MKKETFQLPWLAVLVFLLLSSVPISILRAQKQASIWYLGNGNGINFNHNPPSEINDAPMEADYFATICDADGKLLMYCNDHSVFNGKGEVMKNGTGLQGVFWGDRTILPHPGNRDQYYIFHVATNEDFSQQRVIYALVDLSLNGGQGEVISKNNILYEKLHGSFTVSGNCDNGYWLVGDKDSNMQDGTDKLVAYNITKEGLSASAVVSIPVSIGSASALQFSPDGKHIIYHYNGNGPEGMAIGNFNRETGRITNHQEIGPCCGDSEFSRDGGFLYSTSLLRSGDMELRQYDLHDPDFASVAIDTLRSIWDLQLAPDGKIYFIAGEQGEIGVIHNPEKYGIDCNLIFGVFDFPAAWMSPWLPQFATNLLVKKASTPDAGPDIKVCSGVSVAIGSTTNPPFESYTWTPATHLNNPGISNPIFNYVNTTDQPVSFTYYKTLACEYDKVIITVNPEPKIEGSKSVCPGVANVICQTYDDDTYSYSWSVTGGSIVAGQGTNMIEVTWGATNPSASVMVRIESNYGCIKEINYPVKVNVELETETPSGLTKVCVNKSDGNNYSVWPTNGSIYEWEAIGGVITTGDGSHQVTVDWLESAEHWIRVKETSVTIDTVCYGLSDPLLINVYKDSLELKIDFVSVDTADNSRINLTGTAWNFPGSIPLYLNRSDEIDGFMYTDTVTYDQNAGPYSFTDIGLKTDTTSYTYMLQGMNGCDELVSSLPHQSILLQIDTLMDTPTLRWNTYNAWPQGVAVYEIFRKVDSEPTYTLYTAIPGNAGSPAIAIEDARLGFTHEFMVRARDKTQQYSSWSNSASVTFNHILDIPNVFTPDSGDDINTSFNIKDLQLYPENELIIYNRWGREVLRTRNYQGDWRGTNVSAGVYYYRLYTHRNKHEYNGWVHIIR